MLIEDLIERLKERVPDFSGRVEGALNWAELKAQGRLPQTTPAANVISVGLQGGTLTAFQKPQAGSTANTPTFTINAVPFVMRSFSLDLKNAVEPRFLIGAEQILITQREEEVETVVEAQPLTAFNPFTLAQNQTTVPVVLAHGTGAGRITTLNMPAAQVQRLQGLESAQDIKEWPLRLAPLPVTGNDQWTLTLT